ncbi:MAG: DNA invertase Pin-like site-specific DNA recombinase [Halioglobus sp.]|jgi:DNA invertase Pin-like site-specific DNA recombinase
MERELIAERTRAGLTAAKKLGRVGGRKRQMTDSKIAAARNLLEGGAAAKDVAHDLGVSVPTLYRWFQHLHGHSQTRTVQQLVAG